MSWTSAAPFREISTGPVCFALLGWGAVASAGPPLAIEFVPQTEAFAPQAAEYAQIWASDGDRIVAALEEATGLTFEPGPIRAIVLEEPSSSGYRQAPMRLRASYPEPTKRATLIHELGHRLLGEAVAKDFEDHPVLFLFLYDVWTRLYARDFADVLVVVEGRRKGIYDYAGAWRTALAMSAEQRAAKLREFLLESRGRPPRGRR